MINQNNITVAVVGLGYVAQCERQGGAHCSQLHRLREPRGLEEVLSSAG